jgi:hypothetical protein
MSSRSALPDSSPSKNGGDQHRQKCSCMSAAVNKALLESVGMKKIRKKK